MVKKNNNCLIIAEIGQAHEGSLGLAHSYIDAVSSAGVDIVKFQTFTAKETHTKKAIKASYLKKTTKKKSVFSSDKSDLGSEKSDPGLNRV